MPGAFEGETITRRRFMTGTVHAAGGVAELGPEDLAAAMRLAVTVAALTCSRAGADPPWRAEVQSVLGAVAAVASGWQG